MSTAVNTKVSLDQLLLKTIYYRYKVFLIPVSTITVCVILFLTVIMPQIQTFLTMRDQVEGDSTKLATLQKNLTTISRLDDTKLDTYLTIASDALPTDKDFAGVLSAISSAAATAGSILGDYNFQIGDLIDTNVKGQSLQLPLQLSITIKGDLDTGRRFIEALKQQLPLSDVTSISVNSNGTISLAIVFYYAPLPKITFDDSMPLITVSPKDQQVLDQLNESENSSTPTLPVEVPRASDSASLNL